MKVKKIIVVVGMVFSLSLGAVSMAATYTGNGYISKSFSVKNGETISAATGSVLYQKGVFKDTIIFQGITTNQLTTEFTGYVGNSKTEKKVHHITLPLYNGTYKYKKEEKVDAKYTYGKLKVYCSAGTNYLKAKQPKN